MPGDRGAADPVRYALLGLLRDRPSYGYELARRFGRGTALGDIVRLAPSHLYALLAGMERDGLIEGRRQDAGARPQRRVYSLTARGRALLPAWLQDPVSHPRDMRIEFPLKLYIARLVEPTGVPDLLERQRITLLAYVEQLEEMPLPPAEGIDRDYIHLMRSSRVGRARAALDWLDAAERIVTGPT